MQTNYKTQATAELAQRIRAAGFRVFIAKSGTYGFYTDAEGTRVVCFQFDLGGFKFSGNYKTSNPRSTGTGWSMGESADMTSQGFTSMFRSYAPSWAVRGAEWRFTTLAEHLKTYQASSQYTEFTN